MMDGYYSQMTHTCNYCNKILPTYGDLVQHKKTHVGERPFSCHICHKRFTQKAHLNIHKRTHTGEKPYACNVCHKRFSQTSHLNSHRRIHADDRPFYCVVCNTGFSQKHRFDTHLPCMQQAKSRSSTRISAAISAASTARALASYAEAGGLDGNMDVDQKPDVRFLESLNQQALMQQLAEFSAPSDNSPVVVKSDPETRVEEGEIRANNIRTEGVQASEDSRVGVASGYLPAMSSHRRKPSYVRHVDSEEGFVSIDDKDQDSLANGEEFPSVDNTNESGDDLDEPTVHFQNGGTSSTELPKTSSINTAPMPANQSLLPTRISPLGASNMSDSSLLSSHGKVNHRISLVNFTAEELLQHMMSRGDVHRCDYCHLIFQDAAMYHIHRNMHNKNDLRGCNFCGKIMQDRYDFTAHFLTEHR